MCRHKYNWNIVEFDVILLIKPNKTLQPLNRIHQNFTGSNISTSSNLVFSRLIGKLRCRPGLWLTETFSRQRWGYSAISWCQNNGKMAGRDRSHEQCFIKPWLFKHSLLQTDCGLDGLKTVAAIMKDSDVSPFEIIHSGLVQKLLQYLTSSTGLVPRDVRIRRFLHIFLNCPVNTVNVVIFALQRGHSKASVVPSHLWTR